MSLPAPFMSSMPTGPVVIGTTLAGQPVAGHLFDTHWFLTGGPRSGKTGTILTLIAAASSMRDVELWLIDASCELRGWAQHPSVAGRYSDPSSDLGPVAAALSLEVERRAQLLAASDATRLLPGADTPLLVVFVDEVLAAVSRDYRGEQGRPEFAAALALIAREGRALGVSLVLSSQQPTSSAVRPLVAQCGHVLAFTSPTARHADLVLRGFPYADPSVVGWGDRDPGLGWLVTPQQPEAQPVRAHLFDGEPLRRR